MSNAREVTIAHALFAYTVDDRQRIALRGETVNVTEDEFDAGTKAGAFVVPPADVPPDADQSDADGQFDFNRKAEDVLEYVGTDADRVKAALAHEQGKDKPRVTLVADLEKLTNPS